MPTVQFRVHPGVGCARMGNSDKTYHLASEFPYFLQERFPNLRFRPKPRAHPKRFFPTAGDPATFTIFDPTPAFQDRFKEGPGLIFPQAARFRVFAYVFDKFDGRHPRQTDGVAHRRAGAEVRLPRGDRRTVAAATVDPS